MDNEERIIFQKNCMDRWNRYLSDRAYMRGYPKTWKPVMSEKQKQEHQQYVAEHQLPF
jgi:hypothetical protein